MRRLASRRRCAGAVLLAVVLCGGCADPARERLARAERAFLEQKMEAALAAYRSIPKDFPQSRYAPAALLRQGDLFSSFYRNYPAALEAYDSLVFNYPRAGEVPEAYLRRGEILLQQYGDHAAAVEDLERIRKLFPAFERTDEVLLLLAKAYSRAAEPAREAAVLRELIERFPDSPRVGEGRWMLALGYLSERRFPEAGREFRKLLYLASDAREAARARWGLGQALEGMGNLEEALAEYEAIRDGWEDPGYVDQKIARLKGRMKTR